MKSSTILILFMTIAHVSMAQWMQVNSGISDLTLGAKLLGSSNNHVFAATLGGSKLYRSNTNGDSWQEINPPVSGNIPESGYFFNNRFFVSLNSSQDCIFFSTDNGSSWNSVSGAPQTTWVRGFIDLSTNLFAYTSSKGIYKSSDGGSTWAEANTGLTNMNVIAMTTIGNKLVAGTIGGGVFVSADNGASWVQKIIGVNGGDLNVSAVWRMGNSLYFYDQGGAAYVSINEGNSWSPWSKPAYIGIGLLEVYRKAGSLYMETRHFAGGGLRDSIFLSTDEGISWMNITENLVASDLNGSGITELNGYTFIAYNLISPLKGIFRRLGLTSVSPEVWDAGITFYPNPCLGYLQYTAPEGKMIQELRFYNTDGQLMFIHQGQSDNINISSLDRGIYFVQIRFADNSISHTKVIKEQ